MNIIIKYLKNFLIPFFLKKVKYLNFYLKSSGNKNIKDELETEFIKDNGIKIPIYKNYRYSVKKGWRYYDCLEILYRLMLKGEINSEDKDFVIKAIGNRTVEYPLDEINEKLKKILKNIDKKYFIPDSFDNNFIPKWAPSEGEINKNINILIHKIRDEIKKYERMGIFKFKKKMQILEIGYTSGGYSLFAFEKLGFKPYGIDNYYGGIIEERMLHSYIKQKINSSVEFYKGDITERNDFFNTKFDIIYSISVLEHIMDIPKAFKEMHNLLKPNGLLIHSYGPFFSLTGGHAIGTFDSPWAHVRLNKKERIRYLNELRPNEFKVANEWFENAINFISLSQMKNHIIKSGFEIIFWQENHKLRNYIDSLNNEIINDCISVFDNITINDLITQTVTFIAKKI